MTRGGDLPADILIHAICRETAGTPENEIHVMMATYNTLIDANSRGAQSIAFPPMVKNLSSKFCAIQMFKAFDAYAIILFLKF